MEDEQGWIKLHRKSLNHWIYKTKKPLTRREAWENMLMIVNYSDCKVLIKGQLYDCFRGQSLLSLESWAKEFNWTKQQVRTFFELLKKDSMINIEGLQYTTRLTICNYDIYQYNSTHEQHTNNTQNNTPPTHRQHTANTPLTSIKEGKEGKEGKEKDKRLMFEIDISNFSDLELKYFNLSKGFLDLFLKNQIDAGIKNSSIKKTKYSDVNHIRKMCEIDKYDENDMRTIWKFLNTNSFWKKNIVSLSKLREQAPKLLLQIKSELDSKKQENKKEDNFTAMQKQQDEIMKRFAARNLTSNASDQQTILIG